MVLAHGGVAGGATEVAVLLLPVVILALLAWRARRAGEKQRADESPSDELKE